MGGKGELTMRIRIESRDCVINEEGYLNIPDDTLEALNALAKIGRFRVVSAEMQREEALYDHEVKMKEHAKVLASYAKAGWGTPPAAPIVPDPASFETYLVFETDYD